MLDYIIVHSSSISEVESEVNKKMALGYKPIGGIARINPSGFDDDFVDIAQAMVRENTTPLKKSSNEEHEKERER